jgi:hypothetical protein
VGAFPLPRIHSLAPCNFMPKYKQFDVYVKVGDVRLSEYDVTVTEETLDGIPVISCWIPSESGEVSCLPRTHPHVLDECRAFVFYAATPAAHATPADGTSTSTACA